MSQEQSPPAGGAKIAEMPGARPMGGQPQGGAAPQAPAAGKGAKIRRIVLPIVVLAALGYGARAGYDYFTTGRFLVATDDAGELWSPAMSMDVVQAAGA